MLGVSGAFRKMPGWVRRSLLVYKKGPVFQDRGQIRLDSGGLVVGKAEVRDQSLGRKDRISEVLARVRERDGLPKPQSHLEHLVGRASSSSYNNTNRNRNNLDLNSSNYKGGGVYTPPHRVKSKDMSGLNIADKTEAILKSLHPVRYILERELYKAGRDSITYHDWISLIGRGMKVPQAQWKVPLDYETTLSFISKAVDSGMFSSEVHQTVVDIPRNFQPFKIRDQLELGNKYTTLVGDYFAIRCIYYSERTKASKALIAMTRGLEEFCTAPFKVHFLDRGSVFPVLPKRDANLKDWIQYNRKSSGYFNGGLYALSLVNQPKGRGVARGEFTRELKTFSANLSVFLKGVLELEGIEHSRDLDLTVKSPFALLSLPAILYQQKNPQAFDSLRKDQFTLQSDRVVEVMAEIDGCSEVLDESRFILEKLATEAKSSFERMTGNNNPFYTDAINNLIDAVNSFD